MPRHRDHIWLAVIAVAGAVSYVTLAAQQPAPQRGSTYQSLADLPKLAGAWGAGPRGGGAARGGPPGAGRGAAPAARQGGPPFDPTDLPPLKDQRILARFKEAMTLLASGADNVELQAKYGDVLNGRGGGGGAWRDLGSGLCDTYGGAGLFTGRTGGGPETIMEILFTPGRVTITTDRGLIRRIYTDGRAVPTDTFVTATGTSVGRWEGTTLIVDTVGLSPKILLAGVPLGEGWRVSERMYVDDRDVLHIDGTIVAPDALTGPYSYTQTYSRFQNANYMLGQFLTECDKEDRSIDRTTNTQRFDLTPPKDLPPPPKD